MRLRSDPRARPDEPPRAGEETLAAPGELPFDDAAFESRLAWILGSARTGSTWLLRMLIHPWELARNDVGMRLRDRTSGSGPSVVPINESHIPVHLTPLRVPPYDPHAQHAPEDFLFNTSRAGHAAYLFNEDYADAWRPELRRLILARLWAQAQRAAERNGGGNPLVAIKEPNGSHGAQLLMSLLPRAKLVFLVRDGRDVVDSQLALRSPGGDRSSERSGLSSYETRLTYVLKQSRLWVQHMSAVKAAYDAHDAARRCVVRYEDLRRETLSELDRLLGWLGVDRSPDEVRAAVEAEAFEAIPDGKRRGKRAAQPGLWRKNLSPLERKVAEEVMGDTLAELGYPV